MTMAAAPHGAEAGQVAEAATHGAETAGEHAGGAFPPFDASLFASQLVWFAITFGVLYFIVARFVLPSVASVLERRAGQLASDREGAAAKTAQAEAARTAMERATAKARSDARKMIDDMRAEVQAKLGAEQAEAEARLAKRAEESNAKIAAARAAAMAEIPALAQSLGRDIADRLAPAKG